MKVNKKTIIFMLSIIFLLSMMTAVSATTADNNNTQELTQIHNTDIIHSTDTQNEYTTKSINKIQQEEQNLKTATDNSYTATVTNGQELKDEIENAKKTKYDNYTINYQKGEYDSDYVLDVYNLTWGKSKGTKTLILNGNGITFIGKDKNHFLTVDSGYNFILKNVTLSNFNTNDNGGAICCYGNLTVYDSKFTSNVAFYDGGAVYCAGNLTIYNSTFENNKAYGLYHYIIDDGMYSDFYEGYGGAVYCAGCLTIYNSIFNNNTLTDDYDYIACWVSFKGGAVYCAENLTIYNSVFNNNILKVSDQDCYGGAISGLNIVVYNSSFKNNNAYWYGGAIYSANSLNIFNSEFEENEVNYCGGAIKAYNLTVYDSVFTSNRAYKVGGAIDASTIDIYNSSFTNNYLQNSTTDYNRTRYGGAIYGSSRINISQSIFDSNFIIDHPGSFGVSNSHSYKYKVIINDENYGGAIYGRCPIFIQNSKFINNTLPGFTQYQYNYSSKTGYYTRYTLLSKGYGGAIFSTDNITVLNSEFKKNMAYSIGDAVYSIGSIIISDSKFENNKGSNYTIFAKNTWSAITTKNSEFNNNSLYSINAPYVTIYNSKFNNNTIKGSTQLSVYNSTFNTNISLTTSKVLPHIGEDIILTVSLKNQNGEVLEEKNLTIQIASETYSLVTEDNGEATLNYTISSTGNIKIIISYNGDYHTSTLETFLTIPKEDSKISLNNIPNTVYSNTITIQGKLMVSDNSKAISNQDIKVIINDEEYYSKTDNDGIYSLTTQASNIGSNNVIAIFEGNDLYNPVNTSTTFNVMKKNTKITINTDSNATYHSNFIIEGKLTDSDNNGLVNQNVTIKINNQEFVTTTENDGSYSYNYLTQTLGINNITVSFENENYNLSSTTKTFTVNKKDTLLTFEPIDDNSYGDQVILSGKLTDIDGNIIPQAIITIKYNSKSSQVLSDNNGEFNLELSDIIIGQNNVNVTFSGNQYYNPTSQSVTFNTKKRATSISIDPILNHKIGDQIDITGYLKDDNYKGLSYKIISIRINDDAYNVITDNEGGFSLEYMTEYVGINSMLVTFGGNNYYEDTSSSATFIVNSKNTSLTINKINDTYLGNTIIISGCLIDEDNNIIIDEKVYININDLEYVVKTDSSGIYSMYYAPSIIGTNYISIEFNGNEYYEESTTSTTFIVNKIATNIIIDDIKYSDKVIITGKLITQNNVDLEGVTITIQVNNNTYTVKTDSTGEFTLTVPDKSYGINNVTVTYKGNNKYSQTTNKTTFIVKQPTMIKYANIANVELGTTVKIVGRLLSNVTGQAIKYAQVTVKVNNETYKLKTDGAGYVRLNYTVNDYNIQKITFKYNGNSLNLASSNSTTFKVKQSTWIKTASISNTQYGSTVKIIGRLLKGTTAVKYVPVNVTVNGKVYNVKTDGAGYIRVNHTVNSYDVQKVTFKFAGDNLYLASSNSTSFKVKQPTSIKIANMANVKYGSTVKLVGRLLYNGTNAVKYTQVNVTVNGKTYKVKTDGAGYIRLNYTVNNYDNQKVTFKFAGNSLYLTSSNSTTFKVKQPTWIKHVSIGKVKQGSKVKIVGRVLYNGTNSVKYVPVNVTVNGKLYKLKTDGAGYFRLNYTATTVGTISFISNFGGNTLYLASTNSTKFTVVKS